MREIVDKTIEMSMVIMVIAITITVLWQVTSRFVFGDPSSFTEELAKYLLIWITFMGAAYTSGKKLNIAIDLMTGKLPASLSVYLTSLIHALVILFVLIVMVIGGISLVILNWELGQKTAALQIPMAVVYLILPVSGSLIIFYESIFLSEEIAKAREIH